MAKLKYIGPSSEDGGGVPLPEGWPAESHSDDDEERVKAKLAQRLKTSKVNDDGTVDTVWGKHVYELDEPVRAAKEEG